MNDFVINIKELNTSTDKIEALEDHKKLDSLLIEMRLILSSLDSTIDNFKTCIKTGEDVDLGKYRRIKTKRRLYSIALGLIQKRKGDLNRAHKNDIKRKDFEAKYWKKAISELIPENEMQAHYLCLSDLLQKNSLA